MNVLNATNHKLRPIDLLVCKSCFGHKAFEVHNVSPRGLSQLWTIDVKIEKQVFTNHHYERILLFHYLQACQTMKYNAG